MSIKEKFYNRIGNRERKFVEISEFGEKIYFTPITVSEMEMIKTKAQVLKQDLKNPTPTFVMSPDSLNIWTIIVKAEDEAGEKIFSDNDKGMLEQMDFSIVVNIANAIHSIEPLEELMKKFREGGDPLSGTSSPLQTEKNASSSTSKEEA